MKKNKILVLHGWDADPSIHWFPKLKENLSQKGYEVFVPELPGGYFPKKEEWLKIVDGFRPDENWILIGHSLGGVTILRYLENATVNIAQAILIATPFEPMKFGPITNFFERGFNWDKIKNNCPQFDIIIESNDPAVPTDHGQKLAEHLNCKLHILPGYSHFHSIDLDYLEKLITNN